MIVIAFGSRSRRQHAFDLLQLTTCFSQEHRQLALLPPRLLQFIQERADHLGPLGIPAQVANPLPPVRSPAQLEVRTSLLPIFRRDKTLSRQRLYIRRRQAEAGQPVALNGTGLCFQRFVHVRRHSDTSRAKLPNRSSTARYALSSLAGNGALLPESALSE